MPAAITHTEQFNLISNIAKRALPMMREHIKKISHLDIIMDIDYTNKVIPLDLQKFLYFDNFNFMHDITGIYVNFNRETLEMENCFRPRCAAKPELVIQEQKP